MNDAFQFPHIAGPVIVTQQLERFVGEEGAFASALAEIFHEQWDVGTAFAQGGDGENLPQTVIQVFA